MVSTPDTFRRGARRGKAEEYDRSFATLCAHPVPLLLDAIGGGSRVGVTVWPQPAPPLQRLWDEVIAAAGVVRPDRAGPAAADDFPRTVDGLTGLVRRGGLTGVRCRSVGWEHRVDPEAWWSGAAGGLAGIGAVVAGQSPATVRRMKDAYDRLAALHLDEAGRLCLRTSALLATGTAGPVLR